MENSIQMVWIFMAKIWYGSGHMSGGPAEIALIPSRPYKCQSKSLDSAISTRQWLGLIFVLTRLEFALHLNRSIFYRIKRLSFKKSFGSEYTNIERNDSQTKGGLP